MSSYLPTRRAALKSLLLALAVPVASHGRFSFADSAVPSLPDNVIFLRQHDSNYSRYGQIFNKRINLQPRLIALCETSKGVQIALQYAAQQQLAVAVKSGGHCFEGYSLNNDGLVIDLSLMRNLQYAAADQSLLAQPGAKLGGVYEYLAGFQRLIPAGSCAGVGVAGLTLGGGYGFFSRQFGLTCDSLTRVKLVDGQGNLQDSVDNQELLWACRGGNNGNFGVVTELTFKTHPAPKTFTQYRFRYRSLSLQQVKVLAERWFYSMQDLPDTCYSSWVLSRNNLTVLLTDTDTAPAPPLSGVLRRLGLDASVVEPPVKDEFLRGVQRFRGGVEPQFFKNVSAGYYRGYQDLQGVFAAIYDLMTSSVMRRNLLQINTLGGAIANGATAASAAYPHRAYPFLGEFQVYYDQASDTPKAEQLVAQVQAKLAQAGVNAHYCNYPDSGIKNWQSAYYGSAYPRLQALKKALDPQNRIRHPQSVRI